MERKWSVRPRSALSHLVASLAPGLLLLGLLASGCQSSTSPDADRAACTQLVDHVVDLEIGTPPPDPHKAAELEKHRAILKRAVAKTVVADCMSGPVAIRDCELAAQSRAALAHCRN